MAASCLGSPWIQSKGLREAAEFQRNGKQAPELTKASSVAINDDRTHAILEVEWLSHSQLRATVGSKNDWKKRMIGRSVQTLPPHGYYAGTPHKISIPYRIVCSLVYNVME